MKTYPAGNPGLSRRDFVSMLAAAGVTLPLAGLAAQPARPTAMAADATTLHVFSKPLQWQSYDEAAALIAETGYGGIDYSVRAGGHVLPEKVETDLPRAVEAARKAGLKVEMITSAIVNARDPLAE